MSTKADHQTTPQDKREQTLEQLYEVREELALIAASDGPYAKYAENWLESLREAGYDV